MRECISGGSVVLTCPPGNIVTHRQVLGGVREFINSDSDTRFTYDQSNFRIDQLRGSDTGLYRCSDGTEMCVAVTSESLF